MKRLLFLSISILSSFVLFGQIFSPCPNITGLNASFGANGTATITPVIAGTVSATQTNYYWYINSGATQISSITDPQGVFQFPANGSYTVCLNYNDSAAA